MALTGIGLEKVIEQIENISSPYLVLGDDTEPSEVINEVFRKPVSTIIRDGKTIRFRTQLLPNEANGDFQKAALFVEATSISNSGTMFNLIQKPFSKGGNNTMLTIETRITVKEG